MSHQHITNHPSVPDGSPSTAKRVAFGVALVLALILIPVTASQAQGVLSIQINSVQGFDLEMPTGLVIATATPGSDPDPVTATSAWGFTSNGNTVRSLTADLDVAPPAGLTVTVDLGLPTDEATHGSGATVGSAVEATFSSTNYEDVTLWTGARRARATGTATWTAAATLEMGEDDDYTGNMTITFE